MHHRVSFYGFQNAYFLYCHSLFSSHCHVSVYVCVCVYFRCGLHLSGCLLGNGMALFVVVGDVVIVVVVVLHFFLATLVCEMCVYGVMLYSNIEYVNMYTHCCGDILDIVFYLWLRRVKCERNWIL